jgi:hypothetical protein
MNDMNDINMNGTWFNLFKSIYINLFSKLIYMKSLDYTLQLLPGTLELPCWFTIYQIPNLFYNKLKV